MLLRAAWAAFQQGDVVAAEALCLKAVREAPNRTDALGLLGATINAQARYPAAAAVYAELTRREPREGAHWMNLGTVLRAQGRRDEALSAYARAGSLGQSSADFFYNVGLLHVDRGDPESARALFDKARRMAPADAEICFQFAQSCLDCLRNPEAATSLEGWPCWQGLNSELIAKIALLLLASGEAAKAQVALQRAAADPQPSALARLKLAQVYERINQLPAAREQLAKLKDSPVPSGLAQELVVTDAQIAQREARHDVACEKFADILAACSEFRLRHVHLFPYARSLDALQQHEAAFDALTEAHRSQVEHLAVSAPQALARRASTLAITRYGCSADDVASWRDQNSPSLLRSPVFIVAFPRSGTTLLEQSLDAHPLLATMDEQPFLQNAIDLIVSHGCKYPESLGRMSDAQLQAVRDAYWKLATSKVQLKPGQRLIDKNPLNLLRLPAIRRLFPSSPILLTVRHPCDVILSCFMQHFTAPEFALLCRDLPALAQGFVQAFDFWYGQAALLGGAVREIRYESFVADFASQVYDLCEFLQLPLDDAMLAPAEHALRKGFISTPSYSQVVQPVNRKAIDRWRCYEGHFVEVLPVLRKYLLRWGYEDSPVMVKSQCG